MATFDSCSIVALLSCSMLILLISQTETQMYPGQRRGPYGRGMNTMGGGGGGMMGGNNYRYLQFSPYGRPGMRGVGGGGMSGARRYGAGGMVGGRSYPGGGGMYGGRPYGMGGGQYGGYYPSYRNSSSSRGSSPSSARSSNDDYY